MNKFISKFLNIIAPTMKKRDVMDDLENLFKEFEEYTVKMLILVSPSIQNVPNYKKLESGLKAPDYSGRLSVQEAMLEMVQRLTDNRGDVMDFIDKSFKNKIVKDTLDFHDLNALAYISAMRFANKYCKAYVSATLGIARQEQGFAIKGYDKMAIEFVNDEKNIEFFHKCFTAIHTDFKDIMKTLKDLKGITASEDFNEAAAGLRPNATDPFKFGFLAGWANPAYWAGILFNRWVKYNYEKTKAEYERAQLQVLALEQELGAFEDDQDQKAKIEKQISFWSKRIVEYEVKIRDIEEEVS